MLENKLFSELNHMKKAYSIGLTKLIPSVFLGFGFKRIIALCSSICLSLCLWPLSPVNKRKANFPKSGSKLFYQR